jgi:competence protein ComEC
LIKTVLYGLTVVILLQAASAVSSAALRVHFIAVGHGDAILIEEDGTGVALIDAGKAQYGSVVLSYLQSLGIDSLAHLFVTHNHEDHVGGIPLILDSLYVGTVHHTGMVHDWESARVFQCYMDTQKWRESVVDVGDIPVSEGNLQIEVLSPHKSEVVGKAVDANRYSMALMLSYGDVKILLPADIDKKRESWLLKQYGDGLRCQAMKASHHASKFGNIDKFLSAVDPDIVVVCVGPNDWGYPSAKTLQRLSRYCPNVLRTDHDGTVVLETDGEHLDLVRPEALKP